MEATVTVVVGTVEQVSMRARVPFQNREHIRNGRDGVVQAGEVFTTTPAHAKDLRLGGLAVSWPPPVEMIQEEIADPVGEHVGTFEVPPERVQLLAPSRRRA